eukprot:6210790-Pleurochrysis_carterae.AAC.2
MQLISSSKLCKIRFHSSRCTTVTTNQHTTLYSLAADHQMLAGKLKTQFDLSEATMKTSLP